MGNIKNNYDLEKRIRITQQVKLVKKLGWDFIHQKQKELCDNCTLNNRCGLLPDAGGCCYFNKKEIND